MMATSGRKLEDSQRRRVLRMREHGLPLKRIAGEEDLNRNTVRKIVRAALDKEPPQREE